MTHDYHEGLPGYSPDQLLHAGCAECEERSEEHGGGLAHLDQFRFALAWSRAARWQSGLGSLPDLDRAEIPMLETLWTVQLKLQEFGVPIGTMPTGDWYRSWSTRTPIRIAE
jgi:hypothetical protein